MPNSFVFNHALRDVFCFPMIVYPILHLSSYIVLVPFLYLKQKMDDLSAELPHFPKSEQQRSKIEHQIKEFLSQCFKDYTPLPQQIVHGIVYEYMFDPQELQKDALWRHEVAKSKQSMQHKLVLFKNLRRAGYAVYAMMHLLCWICIISLNVEWSNKHDKDSWTTFQSVSLTFLSFLPQQKLNFIAVLSENNENGQEDTLSLLVVLATFYLPSLLTWFVYWIPSMGYYMVPIWALWFPIYLLFMRVIEKTEDKVKEKSFGIQLLYNAFVGVCMSSMIYLPCNLSDYAMSCAYSGQIRGNQRWYLCLYEALQSPYCERGTFMFVNWSDWRAVVLFITWVLL